MCTNINITINQNGDNNTYHNMGLFFGQNRNSEAPPVVSNIKYGRLYNFPALTNIVNSAYPDFHVPTQADFETLFTELGGASIAGGKLKEIGLINWDAPNTGATNEVGFNSIGSGYRNSEDGLFFDAKLSANYWASNTPYSYNIFNNDIIVDSDVGYEQLGLSVRLVNNDTLLADGEQGIYIGNDGREYKTICIGTQEWLAENLAETLNDSAVSIPNVTDNSAWAALTTPGRCSYDNDESNVFL